MSPTYGSLAALRLSGRVPGRVIITLTCCIFIHVLGRWLVSSSVELDQAEQVILAQEWRWSYGAQPPLYSWLQAGAFALFGTNLLALTLVKAGWLIATFQLLYLTGREMGGERAGLLALFGALLIPQVVWELQRDLTHSAALAATSVFTLFSVAKLLKRPSTLWYFAFGLSVALGTLSKYNYLLLLASLVVAWLTIPAWRPHFFDRRLGWSIGAFACLIAPCVYWSAMMLPASTDPSVLKFLYVVEHGGNRTWESLRRLVVALVVGVLPCVLVFLILLFKTSLRETGPTLLDSYRKLVERTLMIGVLLCLAFGFFAPVHFKDRLLLPLLMAVPIGAALWASPRLSAPRWKWVMRGGALATLAAVLALPLVTMIGAAAGRPNRLTAPFDRFAEELKKRAPDPDIIIAGNRWVGGNLKLHFPRSQICVPGETTPLTRRWGVCLVAWDATERSRPSPRFWQFVSKICGDQVVDEPASQLDAPFKYSKTRIKLGYQVHRQSEP